MSIISRDSGDGRAWRRGARLVGALALVLAIAGSALLASGGIFSANRKGGGGGGARGPRVQFLHGRLASDGTGVYRIGSVRLIFTTHSFIVVEGKAASTDQLSEGLEASIVGRPTGAGFMVEQCTAADPVPIRPRLDGEAIQWSTEDPTVGWGRSPS